MFSKADIPHYKPYGACGPERYGEIVAFAEPAASEAVKRRVWPEAGPEAERRVCQPWICAGCAV